MKTCLSKEEFLRLGAKPDRGAKVPRLSSKAKSARMSPTKPKDEQTPKPKRKSRQGANVRQITDLFTTLVKSDLGETCIKEFQFHPTRKWRFDYAIPEHKIALEVEGGVWTGGRHTRPQGFLGDIEKYNTATLLGWRVFRTTPSDLLRSCTLDLLEQAIKGVV